MKKAVFFISVYLIVLILYFPVFGSFFSQDDFFHFKISLTNGSFNDFIRLFNISSHSERGYDFFRPLTREVLYHFYYERFGINAIPFHILSFFIHFLNIYLVFKVLNQILNDRRISMLASFFFGISAVNVGILYYTAGGIQISIATTFALLTLLSFAHYIERKRFGLLFLSFVTFLLGLCSHELAGVIPGLLFGLLLIRVKTREIRKYIFPFVVFGVITALYIYIDFMKIGVHQEDVQYKTVLSIFSAGNTLMWYIIWSFGVPEMLVDFVGSNFAVNPNLMKYWGDQFSIIFLCLLTIMLFLTLSLILLLKKRLISKEILFLAFWFLIGLAPVILLPQHKFIYYLGLSLPAFCSLVSFIILKSWDSSHLFKIPALGTIICIIVLSIVSIKLQEKTYWAAARGKLAERILTNIKLQYPNLEEGSILFVKNDPNYPYVAKDWGGTSKQAMYVLNNQDGVQLLYKDFSLKTYYEDSLPQPKDLSQDKLFSIVAVIN